MMRPLATFAAALVLTVAAGAALDDCGSSGGNGQASGNQTDGADSGTPDEHGGRADTADPRYRFR